MGGLKLVEELLLAWTNVAPPVCVLCVGTEGLLFYGARDGVSGATSLRTSDLRAGDVVYFDGNLCYMCTGGHIECLGWFYRVL